MNNKIKNIKYFTILLAVCFIISCGNKKTETTQTTEAKTEVAPKVEEHEEHAEGEVALTLEQYKAVQIETGIVEMRNLNSVVKANGYTSVPPQNSASVSA
ncbi:MAG: hypothetical protein KA526_11775, partial [Chitinophagales bacterium]|nr:hypothetical protein [Chitinophagales bacterium]